MAAFCGCSPSGESGGSELAHAEVGAETVASAHTPLTEAERRFYLDAAGLAWRYMEANYSPATGLVRATPDWDYTAIWDVGGQLLAFLAAKELGLITPAEYDQRTGTTLNTLERLQLFRGLAYNKLYSTRDGSLARAAGVTPSGWSATDLGRLLVALKVLATREPQYADQAERIVRRLRFDQIVRNGYLHGRLIGRRGRPWSFQEGRIGYEQYSATGFALWGARVDNALDLNRNGEPTTVLGVEILRDKREQDRLVSEPFILFGLELGLPPDLRRLAEAVLAAQEARYRLSGQITVVSEDAISLPPHYFYYYCVYCSRRPFVIDAAIPVGELDIPRWVSTKAAFGWHAIMPSEYTQMALEYVASARDEGRGWASGIYEATLASTRTYDVNTAAVILETAAFQLRGGRPLMEPPGEVGQTR